MTSKKLLISWFLLAVVATLGNFTHGVMMKQVPEIAAKEAPKYLHVTDSEAIKESLASCNKDPDRQLSLAMNGFTCESAHANPSARQIELIQMRHNAVFYSKEIKPRVEKLENSLDTNVTRFNVVMACAAAVAFLLWCKSTLFPFVVQFREKLRDRAPLSQDLKAMGANRRVRQAEDDFLTLKNLHDNGLISEEMFLKRKEELKAALISNEVFRT